MENDKKCPKSDRPELHGVGISFAWYSRGKVFKNNYTIPREFQYNPRYVFFATATPWKTAVWAYWAPQTVL